MCTHLFNKDNFSDLTWGELYFFEQNGRKYCVEIGEMYQMATKGTSWVNLTTNEPLPEDVTRAKIIDRYNEFARWIVHKEENIVVPDTNETIYRTLCEKLGVNNFCPEVLKFSNLQRRRVAEYLNFQNLSDYSTVRSFMLRLIKYINDNPDSATTISIALQEIASIEYANNDLRDFLQPYPCPDIIQFPIEKLDIWQNQLMPVVGQLFYILHGGFASSLLVALKREIELYPHSEDMFKHNVSNILFK